MTEILTIGQASGRKISKPDGSYFFLERYDPFSRMWYGSGYDMESHDSVSAMLTSDRLLEFGIEIRPSKEELSQIEALRLTNKVQRAAAELSSAITEWLNNPAAR